MNNQEAKEILLLFRPGTGDQDDPGFADALALARTDPELKAWFERHCAVQKAVASGFQGITPPEGLKEQILSERKVQSASGSRRKSVLVAVAAFALALVLGLVLFPLGTRPDPSFSTFRTRMMGKVLRDYPRMDLETNDLATIHQYLAAKLGQKDYVLPAALEKTAGTGCAIFDWQGKRVSMVCFNSGKNGDPRTPDLFLFIADKSAVRHPPGGDSPELQKIKRLATASWCRGEKLYVLAGEGDEKFLKQYY